MKIMRNDVRGEGEVAAAGTTRREEEEEEVREQEGERGRGWKTDKDKVQAKVGSWARKWWVAVVRVVATAKDERAEGGCRGYSGMGEGVERRRKRTERHGGEAPGVARVIALKLPPCKNTPSKRVPTRRGVASSRFVSSRLVSPQIFRSRESQDSAFRPRWSMARDVVANP